MQDLAGLFAYDDWANRECMESLISCEATRPLEIMAHIVAAQCLWHDRIQRRPQTHPVWPAWDLERCREMQRDCREAWTMLLDGAEPHWFDQPIPYTNSKGEPWANSPRDILMHVILHGSYHRGQIATLLGQLGMPSAYTDFIHCRRQDLA